MQVSVVGTPAQPQMLHAQLSPSSSKSPNQASSLGLSEDSLTMKIQQTSASPNGPPQITSEKSLPDAMSTPPPDNTSTKLHPHGLDSTQTGVDFVLQ